MKVILTEAVEKLGQEGEVKEVANGYARNFLFPRGLAIPATSGALKQAEARQLHKQRQVERMTSQAQQQADRLNGLNVLLFARTGEQNRLYGSITAADIAEALKAQHHVTVDRRKITLDNPVHRTGKFVAMVNLGRNITARFSVDVESEANRAEVLEARRQAAEAAAAAQAAQAQAAADEAAAQAQAAAQPAHPLAVVAETAGTAVAAVAGGVTTVAHNIGDAAAPVLQNVGGAAGTLVHNVGEAAAPVLQNVGDAAGTLAHNIGEAAGPLVQNVGEAAGSALDVVRETAGSALGNVTEGAGALLRRVTGGDHGADAEAAVAEANITVLPSGMLDDAPTGRVHAMGDLTPAEETGDDAPAPYTRDDVAYLLDTPVAEMEADLEERRTNPQPGDPPVLPQR